MFFGFFSSFYRSALISSTALSSRPISVSDDVLIVPQGSQNDIVIERPMFMTDATSGGFLPYFCLYCHKIKLFIHHFLPLIAVVWPSETPSVDSGINRIFTVANMILRSSTMLGWAMYIKSMTSLS